MKSVHCRLLCNETNTDYFSSIRKKFKFSGALIFDIQIYYHWKLYVFPKHLAIFKGNSSLSNYIKKIFGLYHFFHYNSYQEIILRCRYLSIVKRWRSNTSLYITSFVRISRTRRLSRENRHKFADEREFTAIGEEDAHRFSSFLMQNPLRRRGIFPTKNNETYDPPARVTSTTSFANHYFYSTYVYLFFPFFLTNCGQRLVATIYARATFDKT